MTPITGLSHVEKKKQTRKKKKKKKTNESRSKRKLNQFNLEVKCLELNFSTLSI